MVNPFIRFAGTTRGVLQKAPPRTFTFPGAPEFPALATGNLWLNLDFAADYVPENFFIDAMRQSRPWRAQTATEVDNSTLRAAMLATADADGYPTSLPAGVTVCGTIILNEQVSASAPALAGRYRLEWQGTGTVDVAGEISGKTTGANYIEFDYSPNGGMVDVQIQALPNPADNVRAMRCYNLDHAALLAAGQVVNPAFKAAYPNISLIRPMQSFGTNTNTNGNWALAPTPTSIGRDASYHGMIQAANELGANLWINIPARADANYVTQLATLVRDNLNPALICYVEYANEWWNYAFGFATYPYLEALRAGKPYDFTEMAGGRSCETMIAWSAVFAGQMSRTVRVAGMHTGYLGTVDGEGEILFRGIDQGFLDAPGWVAEVPGRVAPHTVHDVLALTGYFNVDNDWEETIDLAETNYAAGYAMVVAKAFSHIETLRTSNYPYFKKVSELYGDMPLIMYEGGSHAINPGGTSNSALVTSLLNDFNFGEEIYDVYDAMFKAWHEFSTFPFNQFIGISDSAFGCMAHLNDTSQPRYQAVLDYNDGTLPSSDVEPLPLSTELIVTGHSIPASIMKGALQGVIAAMGGTSDIKAGTGPYAAANGRWVFDPADPDAVKSILEGGTPGAIFIGGEGHGGSYGSPGRASVQVYMDLYGFPPPSSAMQYGRLWHDLADSAGCSKIFYYNFWTDDTAELFDASWRSSLDAEATRWDTLLDDLNAERASGVKMLYLMPWLQVFMAVYDAILNGDVTGIVMGDLFTDNVHPDTPIGRWCLSCATLIVAYGRSASEMPANAGTDANISSGLAAQLRPVITAACASNPRTGLP